MRTQKIFEFTLYSAFFSLLLVGCRFSSRPVFQSDEQLIESFEQNKPELFSLMKRCHATQSSQVIKNHIVESFSRCDVDKTVLESLRLKEVAEEFESDRKPLNPESDFDGKRVLFLTDDYKNDRSDTFIEEKGLTYVDKPLPQEVIEDSSLDQFSGQPLFEKRGVQEVWRYREIEPNWYIYYRQYYYPFLG
jgi:hypothetical protein